MSKDGGLPSYEESTAARFAQYDTSSASDGYQIRDRVRAVREEHISAVINDDIYPLISQQAMYGIGNMTIALIPSDIVLPRDERVKSEFDFDTADAPQMEIVGFPAQLQQIQLDGHMNRLDFWKQQGVVQELERALNEKFGAPSQPQTPRAMTSSSPQLPQRPSKKSFFGRTPSSATETSTPAVKAEPVQKSVSLTARLEEICFRTVSPFGLYETITRQSIIVRFGIGC